MSTAGLRVPGYVVDGLLGRGGAGEVWSARVTGSIDQVALKLVRGVGRDQLDGVRREAAVLSALEHPHLVRLHDVVAVRDGVVLVLDLADAGSLDALIHARGRLTPGEVASVVAAVAAALAYLHGRGIVHGDVAAANILFTATGHPLLADVGVARLTGDSGPVRSTPAYVDPAVAAGDLPAPASDVFMLAAVAFHALTGRPIWPGSSPGAALAAAAHCELPDVRATLVECGVPLAMVTVLEQALDPEPGARGTAAGLALDLAAAVEPARVELAAGRPRVEPSLTAPAGAQAGPAPEAPRRRGGRHAAPPRHAASRRASRSGTADQSTATARAGDAGAASSVPFTQVIGSRPRPVVPARRHRRRRMAVVGVAVLLVLAGAGTAWAVLAGSDRPAHGPRTTGTSAVALDPGPIGQPDATTSSNGPGPIDAASATDLLTGLDVLRQRAFATRSPLLLTGVYVDGPLLDQDKALLNRLVPAGCGLQGVRTVYSSVQVLGQDATSVQLLARAQLMPSVLVCHDKITGQAAGTAGAVVRITLLRVGPAYLISSLVQ